MDRKKPLKNPVLHPHEEEEIMIYIFKKAREAKTVERKEVLDMAIKFLKSDNRKNPFRNGVPGDKWFSLFRRRYNRHFLELEPDQLTILERIGFTEKVLNTVFYHKPKYSSQAKTSIRKNMSNESKENEEKTCNEGQQEKICRKTVAGKNYNQAVSSTKRSLRSSKRVVKHYKQSSSKTPNKSPHVKDRNSKLNMDENSKKRQSDLTRGQSVEQLDALEFHDGKSLRLRKPETVYIPGPEYVLTEDDSGHDGCGESEDESLTDPLDTTKPTLVLPERDCCRKKNQLAKYGKSYLCRGHDLDPDRWNTDLPVGVKPFFIKDDEGYYRESIVIPDKKLPPGWSKHTIKRKSNLKWDVILVNEHGRKFRSFTELRSYFSEHNIPFPEDTFDFMVGQKMQKLRSILEGKKKPINVYKEQMQMIPNQFNLKRKVIRKAGRKIRKIRSEVGESKKPIKTGRNKQMIRSQTDVKKKSIKTGRNKQMIRSQTDVKKKPIKMGWNKQTIRSQTDVRKKPTRKVGEAVNMVRSQANRKRKLIKTVGQVKMIHTQTDDTRKPITNLCSTDKSLNFDLKTSDGNYSCCGKSFRKVYLFKMHMKHYHPESGTEADSTPRVADLAHWRTASASMSHNMSQQRSRINRCRPKKRRKAMTPLLKTISTLKDRIAQEASRSSSETESAEETAVLYHLMLKRGGPSSLKARHLQGSFPHPNELMYSETVQIQAPGELMQANNDPLHSLKDKNPLNTSTMKSELEKPIVVKKEWEYKTETSSETESAEESKRHMVLYYTESDHNYTKPAPERSRMRWDKETFRSRHHHTQIVQTYRSETNIAKETPHEIEAEFKEEPIIFKEEMEC